MAGTAVRAVALAALLGGAACGDARVPDEGTVTVEEQARALHERVLTLDTHDDIPFDFATSAADPLEADRQVTLRKMAEGGLDVGFFVVYVGQGRRDAAGYAAAREAAMTKFEAIHRMTDEMYPDRIGLAYAADDVERIHAEGKLVAAIGIENGWVIGPDLSLLERYHELGARYVTLAHNGHNDIADSATPIDSLGDLSAEHGGLSAFGEEVVAEMNRLGIMIDISHASKQSALDAIEASRAPVMASHSSARALVDHPRNLDDETLTALAARGGVVHVTAVDFFVKAQPPEREEAIAELRLSVDYSEGDDGGMSHQQKIDYELGLEDIDRRFPPADVSDLVDHVDHVVGLVGIDHVGIASDFDGGGGVYGWNDASETFNVTLELVRRGYAEEEIAKLWSGNLLRVWREAERVARESQ